jgi:hypothetical protein
MLNISIMNKEKEKFWPNNLCVLFTDFHIIPMGHMSKNEKLNALTRLVILITIVLFIMNISHWLIFILAAFGIIILLKSLNSSKKEGFSITPTYTGLDLQETEVAPLFAEEWSIFPNTYDLYTNVPDPDVTYDEPLLPQSYPYGQYLSTTNLLPSDEYHTHMLNGGVKQAREYINSSFLRNDLAYRDNMTKIYKLGLARQFQQNSQDTFSPYESY